MSEFPSIAHIAVTVTDLDRSTRWYSALFGAAPVLDEDETIGVPRPGRRRARILRAPQLSSRRTTAPPVGTRENESRSRPGRTMLPA